MSYAKRDGLSLYYQHEGSGDPPLVFVHGWCCDHTFFQPQFDRRREWDGQLGDTLAAWDYAAIDAHLAAIVAPSHRSLNVSPIYLNEATQEESRLCLAHQESGILSSGGGSK